NCLSLSHWWDWSSHWWDWLLIFHVRPIAKKTGGCFAGYVVPLFGQTPFHRHPCLIIRTFPLAHDKAMVLQLLQVPIGHGLALAQNVGGTTGTETQAPIVSAVVEPFQLHIGRTGSDRQVLPSCALHDVIEHLHE